MLTIHTVTDGLYLPAESIDLLNTVVLGGTLKTLSDNPTTVIPNLTPYPRVEKNMVPMSSLWLPRIGRIWERRKPARSLTH